MELIDIGVIAKPHGLKGEVAVKVEGTDVDTFESFGSIYLDQFGTKVPYTVEWVDVLRYDKIKMKLKNVDTPEKAEALRGIRVFQDEAVLPDLDLLDFVDYALLNANGDSVGKVIELIEGSAQDILVVELNGGKEVMIPLDDDLVIEIDEEKEILQMEIPEGLLDL